MNQQIYIRATSVRFQEMPMGFPYVLTIECAGPDGTDTLTVNIEAEGLAKDHIQGLIRRSMWMTERDESRALEAQHISQ